MLKGSTLKALDVRILRNFIESRSAGKYKLHNIKVSATLEFSSSSECKIILCLDTDTNINNA